jgi:hypothetical protein
MGAGAVTAGGLASGYHHLLNPNRKWYNNRRLIALNGWLVLLLITSSTNGETPRPTVTLFSYSPIP